MKVQAVQITQRGQVTLPKALRDEYQIEAGRRFAILDLSGAFLLSPQESRIDAICDHLRDGLIAEGASLEEVLADLRQRRETGEMT